MSGTLAAGGYLPSEYPRCSRGVAATRLRNIRAAKYCEYAPAPMLLELLSSVIPPTATVLMTATVSVRGSWMLVACIAKRCAVTEAPVCSSTLLTFSTAAAAAASATRRQSMIAC